MKTLTFSAIVLSVAVVGFANGAQAQQAKKLFFEGDIVRHALADQAGPFCVLTNQFKRKEAVAWRIRVLEARPAPSPTTRCSRAWSWNWATARSSRRIMVLIRPRMPPTDDFWSLHWEIPADFPTGSLRLQGHRHHEDGRTVTWEPFTRATDAAHGDRGRAGDEAASQASVRRGGAMRILSGRLAGLGVRAVGAAAGVAATAAAASPASALGRKCGGRAPDGYVGTHQRRRRTTVQPARRCTVTAEGLPAESGIPARLAHRQRRWKVADAEYHGRDFSRSLTRSQR